MMRRWNALRFVVSVAMLATALPVFAQSGDSQQGGPAANAIASADLGKLLWTTDFVRFEVILGRVTARNACHGKAQISTLGDLAAGAGEVLTLRVMEGAPRIRYEFCNGDEKFVLVANDFARMKLEHQVGGGATVVRYEQTPNHAVVLDVRCGDESRKLTAPSLWHLWLRHPQICESHLEPCLKFLRPNWRFAEQIDNVSEHLFAYHGPYFLPGDDEPLEADYDAWLKAMSDDRFAIRQAAFARFQKAGIAAKPFLDSVDLRRLDGEQRMRVRQLRKSLLFQSEDSVNRIAAWLRDDRWIWFAFLNDRFPAKRRMAYSHLKRICGDSLTYDPEAEAELRASQITVLEQRVFR